MDIYWFVFYDMFVLLLFALHRQCGTLPNLGRSDSEQYYKDDVVDDEVKVGESILPSFLVPGAI